MISCIGKIKKKKSTNYSLNNQNVNNQTVNNQNVNFDTNPYEIVYSSREKKILQFVNSTNELLEQITSHEISTSMNIQKINIKNVN